MKKNTLLLVSTSFALGVGLIGAGVGASLHQKAPTNKIMEDVTLPDDNIGARVKLAAENDDPLEAAPTFVNTLGYRVIDEKSGAKSVRVYAVTTGYKGLNGVSVTRSVKDSSGASVMAEKTISFGYVYSSIRDADLVSWDEALPEESETVKNYYMVFTLKNVPESHWFDEIDVQFSLDNGAIINSNKAVANVKGLMPKEEGEGVSFALREDVTSGATEYFAYRKDTDITKAVIPSEYYTVEGHVASNYGQVTAIDLVPGKTNTGAFDSCSSLTEIVFPDTINYFGKFSFYSTSSLLKITIPKGLKSMASSAFSSAKMKEIDYDAIALEFDSASGAISTNLDKIVISADVTSLPKRFMNSSCTIGRIEYEGPIADYEALKTEENQNNGLFGDVFATDNQISVTFHLGEAKIGENTGDYVLDTILGKTVSSYKPSLKGKKFDGWYTDAELTTPFDASSALSASIELYPKFVEFGAGVSAENPIVLADENTTFTETIQEGFESVYFKYTHPEDAVADWRYIRINKDSSVKDDATSTGSMYAEVKVYKDSVSDANLLSTSDNLSVIRENLVQKINGSSNENVRVWVEPGKTYYFRANPNSYYTDGRMWCGDLVIEWESREHDSISDAISFDYGEVVTPTVVDPKLPDLYKFTASKTGEAILFAGYIDSYFWTSFKIFDVTDESNIVSIADDVRVASKGLTPSATLSIVEGHVYVVQVSCNYKTTETDGFSFKIDDPLPGSSINTAIDYEIGSEVTAANSGTPSLYYKFTLDSSSSIRFTLTGGSESLAKKFTLLDSDGTQIDQKTEVGITEGYGWEQTTIYAVNPVTMDASLEAGTYFIKAGYDTGNSTYDFVMTSSVLKAGDLFDNPAEVVVTEGTAELEANSNGKFYSVTATQDGFMQFDIACESGITVSLLDGEGKAISSASNNGSFYTSVVANQKVIIKVVGASGTASVTVTYPEAIHDGKTRETAYELDFSSTTTIDITYATGSTNVKDGYFKFVAPSTGTFRLYTNSDFDTKVNGVYEEGNTSRVDGTYNDDDGGIHSPYTQYKYDTYNEIPLEAGKTYYISINLPINYSSTNVILGLSKLGQGDTIGNPSSMAWTGDTSTIEGNYSLKYYSFTSDAAGEFVFSATASTEGASVELSLFKDGKNVESSNNRFVLEAETEYVLGVKTNVLTDVTITKSVYVPPFADSPLIGTYIGRKEGISYFKATISEKGVAWESGGVVDVTGLTTANGITSFTASDKTFYTNGIDMLVCSKNEFYFFSTRLTAYNWDIKGSFAKTKDATMQEGFVILSLVIDDGSTIYCAVKDGTIYFDATVEFASSDESDISTSVSGFTVKDASGNVIGTYTSSSKTLTEVTSPAA